MKDETEKDAEFSRKVKEAVKDQVCKAHGTRPELKVDGNEIKVLNSCCDSFEEKVSKAVKGFIAEFGKVPSEEDKSKLI